MGSPRPASTGNRAPSAAMSEAGVPHPPPLPLLPLPAAGGTLFGTGVGGGRRHRHRPLTAVTGPHTRRGLPRQKREPRPPSSREGKKKGVTGQIVRLLEFPTPDRTPNVPGRMRSAPVNPTRLAVAHPFAHGAGAMACGSGGSGGRGTGLKRRHVSRPPAGAEQ